MQMLLIEAIVCYAFSVELCFKAIRTRENGTAEIGHNHQTLFATLSMPSQGAIKTAFSKIDDVASFDANLKAASGSFQEWRYIYEKQAAKESVSGLLGFLKNLSAASLEVANAMIP